jgi:hypothetical protein
MQDDTLLGGLRRSFAIWVTWVGGLFILLSQVLGGRVRRGRRRIHLELAPQGG